MNAQDLEHLGRDFKQLQAAYVALEARVKALESLQATASAGDGDKPAEAPAKRGPGRPRKAEG
jgi:hypothetical protein